MKLATIFLAIWGIIIITCNGVLHGIADNFTTSGSGFDILFNSVFNIIAVIAFLIGFALYLIYWLSCRIDRKMRYQFKKVSNNFKKSCNNIKTDIKNKYDNRWWKTEDIPPEDQIDDEMFNMCINFMNK